MTALTGQLRRLPQPLNRIRSIKLKLAILMVGSGAAGFTVFVLLVHYFPMWTASICLLVALGTSQLLANGTTAPLRAMTAAAREMSRGDYSRRVRTSSRDEVGQLAEAFNRMAADLEAADRQRRELIANVSHELRTPITALQAVLENIVDGLAEPDPATLRTALAQTQRLGGLVTELLDLSRLEAGVAPLAADRVAISPFLHTAVDAATVGRPITVHVDVQPPELELRADAARLHQVVANLLDNAVRHSPPGGQVVVRARGSQPGGGLLLMVDDEGPGIPLGERARVFDRFSRGSTPGTARDGGTGLGLAIARWAVELHGGTISAADADGRGCRIQVTLPAR